MTGTTDPSSAGDTSDGTSDVSSAATATSDAAGAASDAASAAAANTPATAGAAASPPDPVAASAAAALSVLLEIAGDDEESTEDRVAACMAIKAFVDDSGVVGLIKSIPAPTPSDGC